MKNRRVRWRGHLLCQGREGANHAICNLLLPLLLPSPPSSPSSRRRSVRLALAPRPPQERCFCVWYPRLLDAAMKDKVKEKVVQAVSDELEESRRFDKLRFKRRACRVFGAD